MKGATLAAMLAITLTACSGMDQPSATDSQAVVRSKSHASDPITSGAAVGDLAAVNQSIETVLGGDPADYRSVFDRLQQGVALGDKVAVAALVAYPIEVELDGGQASIGNADAFVAAWDKIITSEVAQAVVQQEFADVLVNAQGVMIGSGQVWISGVCKDTACNESDVRVISIQRVSP